MKLTPQPDGRIAIVFSAEEDAVLDALATPAQPSRFFASVVYEQLMQPSAPELVKLIASLGMPPKR